MAKELPFTDEQLEEVLDSLRGSRESFKSQLVDSAEILSRLCDNVEMIASRKRCEPWSIIGQLTGFGSGMSAAIYELYRRKS